MSHEKITLSAERGLVLVLSRKVEECILIGENITLKVIEIEGDTVKLGLEVPRSVPVHRLEIYEEIHTKTQNILKAIAETHNTKRDGVILPFSRLKE